MSNVVNIGHNNPPTPFDEASQKIDGLYEEAKNWLDGEEVSSQDYADEVSKLINLLRQARKEADAARKEEAKPFDQGKKEVQERYKPLLDKADRATDAAKKALAPFLAKQEEEKRAKAEAERKAAEEAKRKAEEAIRAPNAENLEEREAAEALLKEAKNAEAIAQRAEKDRAGASGGVGRAVTLRTTYRAELADGREASRHYWTQPEFQPRIIALMEQFASEQVRAGVREIPGFQIIEEKKAV